ncbi:hypothetical protein HHUSO_G7593 [Huso huso]|uniref:Uncharacterized protein n=1 Tax=Huso huso TaxID=61971 RepID=A0ABR0ZVJ3_HUSHU
MKIHPLINAVTVSGIHNGADLMESKGSRDELPNTAGTWGFGLTLSWTAGKHSGWGEAAPWVLTGLYVWG